MEQMSELTQELKQYLATSGQGVMSLDAIKKAEQIEKLAPSIKSKMKQLYFDPSLSSKGELMDNHLSLTPDAEFQQLSRRLSGKCYFRLFRPLALVVDP